MKKDVNAPIMSARDLACYILEYNEIKCEGKPLSDIILQKSLYFLFAFWGGFIRQGHLSKEPEVENISEILFNDNIEAWTYGPVVADIYREKKRGILSAYYSDEYIGGDSLFEGKELLKSVIDGILSDLIKVDPFRLVTISHRDKSWQECYIENDLEHNQCIPKESIINEYASRIKV